MRIYNFFADKIEDKKAYIVNPREIRHFNVLRINEGDSVRLIDGVKEYIAEVDDISKKEIELSILSEREDIYSLDKSIDLYMGMTKPDAMSEIVTHLTELGIESIYPVKTEYSFKKVNSDKLQIISQEAAKQCWAVKGLKIRDGVYLKEIDFTKYDLVLAAVAREENKKIAHFHNEILKAKKIAYIIGLEGGFSSEEKIFLSEKVESFSLGNRILRAETAAVVVGGYLTCVE